MSNLIAVAQNVLLRNAVVSWLIAQVAKTAIYAVMNREFDPRRFLGDGGMPSGHSATVTALAVTAAMQFGFSSSQFAISAILAIVVMHDAMGVRLEAGKHAKAINSLTEELHTIRAEAQVGSDPNDPDAQLKEFLGHTPSQVLCGALLGFCVALLLN